jgi:2-iminobutanoate/2-iminopropanoate deaminase
MKQIIRTDNAPGAIGPYSQATKVGNMIFLSGQLPLIPGTSDMPEDIIAQTTQSLKNAQTILQEAGASLAHVVKTTVFLSDIGDFVAMNDVYATFFTENYPARSAFEVACLPKNALVEIEMIAVID